MYLSGNQQVQRSMNGLLKIKASQIDAKNANLTNINNVQNINGKPGEDIIITPDGGLVDLNGNVGITGTLDVSGNSVLNGLVRVDGEIDIYDTVNTGDYIRMFHDPSAFGFKFQLESPNKIMYFRVKDGATPGQYKTFYFASSQLYTDIYFYLANNMTIDYGKRLCFGDYNNGNPYGGSIKFVPSSGAQDGWQFQCTGIQPAGVIYYTNFSNYNLAGVETQTLRMNYNNVWSLVPHTFNSTITVTGTATLNGALNVNATTNLSTTYFNGQISALYITNFYADVYLFSTARLFVNGTTGITQNELSYLSGTTSNIQTQLNGKLSLTGGTMTGALVVNNTITTNNAITQTGTTATTNKITQPRIVGDISGNPNTFKYSKFVYNNSGTSTPEPVLSCVEETSNNSMLFFPKLGGGNYNAIVQANDRGIFSFYPLDSGAITLTCWASTKVGVRVATPSSTTASVDMWAKNCNLKLDSSNNILMTGNNSTSSNPDVSILNSGSARGIQFIANTTASASNPFVALNDAVITTKVQNSSVLTLTTSNSALNYGIKISSASSTSATITSKVASNSIVINETNTTVNGAVTFANNVIVTGSASLNGGVQLSTTTLLNHNILQYGSSVINQDITGTYSGTNQLKNTTFVGDVTIDSSLSINSNMIFSGSYIEFPGGATDRQTKAFNDTNAGYSLSGSTLTFPAGTTINCIAGGIGNEIKCQKFNCYNIIEYSDGSIQNTAYTNALNAKLTAIGTILTSTLTATTTLTSNTFFNCGSITLSAGTYILTLNCCMDVITGSTSVGQLLMAPSTSSTGLSANANLSILTGNTNTFGVGTQWVLTTSAIVAPTTSTNYYMICQVSFGSPNRMEFNNGNSIFQAVRIA